MIDHEQKCRGVVDDITNVLLSTRSDGTQFLVHFLHLLAVLYHQNRGKKGAGLTGAVQQEEIWIDMLMDGSESFKRDPPSGLVPPKDYDYYWRDYPLSHKAIGWNGNGLLALAWSKNPVGGLQRTCFESSIVIVNSHKPLGRGKWAGVGSGVYIIPLPLLESTVRLTSNNKSDSIIPADDTLTCLRASRDQGLFIPFHFEPGCGHMRYLSMWHAGLDAVRTRST
jgi:hypothetical protein